MNGENWSPNNLILKMGQANLPLSSIIVEFTSFWSVFGRFLVSDQFIWQV